MYRHNTKMFYDSRSGKAKFQTVAQLANLIKPDYASFQNNGYV